MNRIREIERINAIELSSGGKGSWHDDYKDSAYIYIGGLPFNLTEGDVICIFSQFGEPVDINLVRDKETGKSRGFCFLKYEDQRSTVLAVDNFSGAQIVGRTVHVDHVKNYRQQTGEDEDETAANPNLGFNIAPEPVEGSSLAKYPSNGIVQGAAVSSTTGPETKADDIDIEDPMRDYLMQQRREKSQSGKEHKHRHRHHRNGGEGGHRHRHHHHRSHRHRDDEGRRRE